MTQYESELAFAVETAVEAGREIRRQYEDHSARTYVKADESPVTDADLASDRIIRGRIAERFPRDAVLTEEGVDDEARLYAERVWIADPIDGTQQYIDRTGQFDVLLALVVAGRPVVSVMVQPATGVYLAAERGAGAWIGDGDTGERVAARLAVPPARPNVVTTIWFGGTLASEYLVRIAATVGAPEPPILQTGIVARGHLDPTLPLVADRPDRALVLGYPSAAHALVGLPVRGDGTMAWEWDYVAADLWINEAGGRFSDWLGNDFIYNKRPPRNEGGLIIANSPALHARIRSAIAPEIALVERSRREE
jgi:3'(2'), 5'-bisphosphate nucleotidase